VANKGFYYTDFITGKLVHSLQNDHAALQEPKGIDLINNQEKEFLRMACTEMTYAQIADKMFLSPKTIDGYRNSLFEKLSVKSRVGLVMFAIKNRMVSLEL
jgi:two-component system, NarL family, invasion response regulator UvrY